MLPNHTLKEYAIQIYITYSDIIDLVVFEEALPYDSIGRCDELLLDLTGNLDAKL
jgi:hypothetical protein